jgi:hypothetical protein
VQSSPIAHQEEQFELSNSSFLQLSTSNENHTPMDKEELEEPLSFTEQYIVKEQDKG